MVYSSESRLELYCQKDVHFIWKKNSTEKPAWWPFVRTPTKPSVSDPPNTVALLTRHDMPQS